MLRITRTSLLQSVQHWLTKKMPKQTLTHLLKDSRPTLRWILKLNVWNRFLLIRKHMTISLHVMTKQPLKKVILLHTRATAIWVSMPVQQQPRSPSLLRTELFFTRSMITITEALLPHPSGQLPTYIISFPRMYISSAPALPDMVKRLSNPHSCLMKARLRRFRIITPLPSSTRK